MKVNKKGMLIAAVVLLLAAALFVGAGAAEVAAGANGGGNDTPTAAPASGTPYLQIGDKFFYNTTGADPKSWFNVLNDDSELSAVWDAVSVDGVVTLKLKDTVTGPGIGFFKNGANDDALEAFGDIIFALNDKTYTVNSGIGSSGTQTQGFHLEQGIEVGFENGTINIAASNKTIPADQKRIVWLINSYNDLYLLDMTIDGTNVNQNMAKGEEDNKFVVHANTGEVGIAGTTITAPDVGADEKPVYAVGVSWNKAYDEGADVAIIPAPDVTAEKNIINGSIKYRLYGDWGSDTPAADKMPKLKLEGEKTTVNGNIDVSPEAAAVAGVSEKIEVIEGAKVKGDSYVAKITTEEGDAYYFFTLKDAIGDVAEDGPTEIQLLRDFKSPGISTDKKFKLNFSDEFGLPHTLTLTTPAVGSDGTTTQGFQLLQNSDITFMNGYIKVDEANKEIEAGQNRIVWLINSYGNLTLEDMYINGENVNQKMAEGEKPNKFVIHANTGTVNITGNTYIRAPESEDDYPVYALDVSWYKDGGYDTGSDVTISTGGNDDGLVIGGPVNFSMYKSAVPGDLSTNGPKLAIKNGIFEGAIVVQEALQDYASTAGQKGIQISGGQFDPTQFADVTSLNKYAKPGYRINSDGKVTPAAAPSKSSDPQGSSTWLTEPTAQPTATPTPTATPGPVETPGVKPVTPTETPAKTPAPFVGILAGLGAAAAVFGLRRK